MPARRLPARHASWRVAIPGIALVVCGGSARGDNAAEVLELPQISVIGTTPLPGSGVRLRDVPTNVQLITGEDLRRQPGMKLTDVLHGGTSAIGLSAAQGNASQPDLTFRGFMASPLLGTPQGISVFVDGVRINEPFGDAVNWDLVPRAVISSAQLIPGSNPAFGLNTLGGALAIYTKSGASEYPDRPGGAITVSGGSFGQRSAEIETGGQSGAWDWFVVANHQADRGWAPHNRSRVDQFFAKVGWKDDATDIDATLGAGDTHLEGVQTIPLGFGGVREPYTYPDSNRNKAESASLKASRALTKTLLLSGTAYARHYRGSNFSSNVNDAATVVDASPAVNDASTIGQKSWGIGLQMTSTATLLGFANQLSVGIGSDRGGARFRRSAQPAAFTADRGTTPLGDFEPDTDADTETRYAGVFASDSLQLDERWTLSLAGRLNRADVRIADRSGSAPGLDGSHRFERFSPSVGLTFNPTARLTLYSGYTEGMRAPTAMELTCADPGAPCKLPNSFLADPPLNKVVSRTIEVGARGRQDAETRWSVALFRTDLQDDLQFVSSSGLAVNAGYFRNFGSTRRQGIELDGGTRTGELTWTLHYRWLDARYLDGFVENSPNNSTAGAGGEIFVAPGDRMPGLPRHALKLRAGFGPAARWRAGIGVVAASSLHARGDENNRDSHGRVPGCAILNVDAQLFASKDIRLFAHVDNLLDRRYATFGILGSNVFTGPGRSFDADSPRRDQFRGYGAPRALTIGMQVAFGGR
jgi:outer membrane receptor protein involved in Fe transport